MNSNKPAAELTTPVGVLKGIGPKRRRDLERAGVRSLEDLLFHMPFRYEDRRQVRLIATLQPGERVLVGGRIVSAEVQKTRRRRFSIFRAIVEDESGRMLAVWFNQPYLADSVKPGYMISLYGDVKASGFGGGILEIQSPQFEVGRDAVSETGIVPVYEKVGSVPGRVIRGAIADLLERYSLPLPGSVPDSILKRLRLHSPEPALRLLHMPPPDADVAALNAGRHAAQRSLVFEEFFMLQAGLAVRRMSAQEEIQGIGFRTSPEIRETLRKMLPFRLTAGQRQAFKEIVEDMRSSRPMRRLLQGDVGCGKTIVALLAAALAVENGYQAALMVPTEILAEQHFGSVRRHLAHTRYRTVLLTGSLPAGEKEAVRQAVATGEVDLVVGTHALIQEGTEFKRLGLAIIDEQHRFGVMQRGRLMGGGAEAEPDVLIMTATPIPRSLTLTIFGDLSVSLIRDMPPGRQPVITAARSERSRGRINKFLEEQMKAGRQVYAVAPVIEESKDDELRTAKGLYERMRLTFPHRRIGLLHGRLKAAESEEVMGRFAEGEIDILASTTVIEVGVDVPNATVMLIENAERFGLSQLHQLRGRVGRGEHRGYCILIHKPSCGEPARQRLEIMVSSSDGFEIAEKDLEIRGPGDFFGTRQSGMPSLRVGNIVRDAETLQAARREAFRLVFEPGEGEGGERSELIESVRRYWERRYGLVLIG
jgi:ATP-dependent DNA helicase RecG